jgi:hypothetical protein
MSAPGIVLVKAFKYRDNAEEEWSNGYHLNGDAPANGTEWQAQIDALVALEQEVLASTVTYRRAYCYDNFDGTHASVYSHSWEDATYPPVGSISAADVELEPGINAVVCRWDTGRRNIKGRPVYLYKYFHGVFPSGDPASPDAVWSNQLTAAQTFAAAVMAPGDVWQGMGGPDGAFPVSSHANPFVGSHQLRRRGKRPPT